MKTTLLRAGALACALLTTTALTTPVRAQATHPHRQPDANGVDVTYGDSLISAVEGSIGSGEAELRLVRTGVWVASGYNMNGHQWDWIEFTRTPPVGAGSVHYAVNVHGRGEVFSGTGTLPTGSSLTGSANDFVYRTSDGMAIEFTDGGNGGWGTESNFCTGDSGQGVCTLIPVAITQPDRKTESINWEVISECTGMIDSEHLPCHYTPRITSVTNSFGYGITFAYASDTFGGSTWFQRTGASFTNGGASQASVSYSFPSTGVTQVTDTGGNVWRFTGSIGGLTGIRRPGAISDTTTISYGGSGGTVSSVTRDGVTTGYSRSVSGSTGTMTITDAASHVTTVVSDLTIGRPTSVTDPLIRQIQYQYDTYGRLTRLTAPEGNYVQYTYDSRGNVTETRRVAKAGTGLPDMVASATFASSCSDASCNEPLTTTDERGNVTDYTYDPTHGGVTSVMTPAPSSSSPNRPETRYSYNLTNGEYRLTEVSACATGVATSTPSCVGTSDETRTVLGYDINGNTTSVEQRSGTGGLSATRTATYDARGNLETVDGPLAGTADTVHYRYNSGRQLIGTIAPDPDGTGGRLQRAQRITYSNGLATRTETGTVNSPSDADWAAFATLQQVDTIYDANSRPGRQTLSANSTTSATSTTYAVTDMSYDALGRPDCSAQRMNSSVWGTTTAACTLQTTSSYGDDRIMRTNYDAAGQVIKVQTAYGVTGQQADEVSTTYRTNGQVETLTDAENNRTTYVYDGHDRLSQTRYPSTTQGAGTSNSSDYEQLTYATAMVGGVSVSTPLVSALRRRNNDTISYTYDSLGRLTGKDVPGSAADVDYAYDNLGRSTSALFHASGQGVSNVFDALSQLTSTSSTMGGTTRTLSFQYDLAGDRTQITHPDSAYFTYNYDVLGRVTLIRESGTNWLDGFSFNDLGPVTDQSYNATWVSSYGFDAVGRVTATSHNFPGTINDLSATFGYSPASQIASRTQSNDSYAWGGHYAVNRGYTADGLNRYTAAGSATFTYDGNHNLVTDGSNTFAYDSENRLVGASGAHSATLAYDPLGRLWQITSGTNTTQFLYDGDALVAEYDGASSMTHRYVHGPGVDAPEVEYAGSSLSSPQFLIHDERGSIIARANASGASASINTYDEHGIPGASNSGRFQYTGQEWLPEIGMYYYRARIYSPTLGRFLQADPIGFRGGMNLYAYAGGDPVNSSDPTGLCSEIWEAHGGGDCGDGRKQLEDALRAAGATVPQGLSAGDLLALADRVIGSVQAFGYAYARLNAMTSTLQAPLPNGVAVFSPLSQAEQHQMNFLLASPPMINQMHEAWYATVLTGREHGFFITATQVGSQITFHIGRLFEGGFDQNGVPTMGFQFTLQANLLRYFYASDHTHPPGWPNSRSPSQFDVNFDRGHHSIGIIQSDSGVTYGH